MSTAAAAAAAADRGESDHQNDLVIADGFPALNTFRPSTVNQPGDPIPRYPFASFLPPSSGLSVPDSSLPSILVDCSRAFTARDKEGDESYSSGATFFVPALMKPRCALEALALDVFRAHTAGLDVGTHYDPERSGAEWWTLVLDAPPSPVEKGGATATTKKEVDDDKDKDKEGGDGNGGDGNGGDGNDDDDDDDEEEEDEVGMHFDADYGLESQLPNYLLHPRVATVTYLSDCGVPTLILDKRSPPPTDATKSSLNGEIPRGWLSHPRLGKHVAFDGRLLHGAPGTFFPGCPAAGTREASRDDEVDNEDGGDAKRRKLDDTGAVAAAEGGSPPSVSNNKRVTFLVNVWLNHCPIDAELLDDEDVQAMTTPWEDDEVGDTTTANGDEKEEKAGLKRDSTYVRPFRFALPDVDSPPSLEAVELGAEEPPAGTEEIVLCNRRVALTFGATMAACRAAARAAAAASSAAGGSALLSFGPGALKLTVGEEVESDEEEATE